MDKSKIVKSAILVFITSVVGYVALNAKDEYFPTDYRKWNHVKTMILEEGHPLFSAFGGIHHVYVNDKGLEAIKQSSGRKFPDGTVIIFDLLEVVKENNTVSEGDRKVLAYMRKDSKNKALEKTGGWEFKAFAKGDRKNQIVKDPIAECFSCHAEQVKDKDYVFSEWRK